MSRWREKAIELFPDMRNEIQAVQSVGDLWDELSSRFNLYYSYFDHKLVRSSEFIPAIYLYADWCTRAESLAVREAAIIGFYESIGLVIFRVNEAVRKKIIQDLLKHVGLEKIRSLRNAFGQLLDSDQREKFLSDCEQVDRDLRRRWKKQ